MRGLDSNRHESATVAAAAPRVEPHPPAVPLPQQGSGIEPVTIPSGILFVPGASASIDPPSSRDSRPPTPDAGD
jgi:hypothetical protein